MDKLKEHVREETAEKKQKGFFSRLGNLFTSVTNMENKRGALIFDLIFFTVGLLFSRCHLVFGAHPLGLAYVSVLPIGVIPAAIGVTVGALTLGKDGIIYALISVIAVFLRIIISGGGKRETEALFGENLLLRMSSSVIAGFVGAVYEILLSGFSQASILFGLSMILLPPIITFIFSGLFSTGIGITQLVYATGNIFSLSKKRDSEKYNIIFFQTSALASLFLITLSLAEFELLGISVSYIFVSFVTLLVARRFGALRALAVGFFSSLGISGVFSVSFALAGLGAGLLFGFGVGYGLVGGFAALSAWSAYSSGLTGFLSTLPEFLIAATLSVPILKNLSAERCAEDTGKVEKSAADMVGTMALTYRNKYSANLDALETSLSAIASVMKHHTPTRVTLSDEEYKNLVTEIGNRHCKSCPDLELCRAENINPCKKNTDKLARMLKDGKKPSAEDINTDTEFCRHAELLSEEISAASARAECEGYRLKEADAAEEYELISKLVSEARAIDDAERTLNVALSDKLTEIIEKQGYADWVIRAFGERHKHLILAGEDAEGERITSPELKAAMESGTGIKLGAPEYFRRDNMALMECDGCRAYAIECATATMAGDEHEVSGDTATAFESTNDYFYALLSDGMGKGEVARRTSEFVCRFMMRALDFGASKDTVLHLLNRAMRKGKEECSATVDLFEFDLFSGEATFIKSGAAPSYVKRGTSIFRIRSQTAPIGLLGTIDTEKIRVEVKPDDYVIMLSDGISQSSEDAPWLLELLSKPIKKGTPKDFADRILSEAEKNSTAKDDMSVIVLKIGKIL